MSDWTKEMCVSHCIWDIHEQISELKRWLPIDDGDLADLCEARRELSALIERIEARQMADVA